MKYKSAKKKADKQSKSDSVSRAFHEVYAKEPRVVEKTRKKFGTKRAQKQKVAIALSKARRGE